MVGFSGERRRRPGYLLFRREIKTRGFVANIRRRETAKSTKATRTGSNALEKRSSGYGLIVNAHTRRRPFANNLLDSPG